MAKLYCKVNSDIRAGLGCRGDKRMEANLLFSYSGGRSADGGVRVCVAESGGKFTFKISTIDGDKESLLGVVKFPLDKRART